MNIRTTALGIGAILLLLLAVTLPAAAAGWNGNRGNQTAGNSAMCPDCTDCEKHQYRYQNSTSANGAGNQAQEGVSEGTGQQLKKMQRHGPAGDQGQAGNGTQGDCNQQQIRRQLRDGSGGNCPRTT